MKRRSLPCLDGDLHGNARTTIKRSLDYGICAINGATSSTYIPVAADGADGGDKLQARASYVDGYVTDITPSAR